MKKMNLTKLMAVLVVLCLITSTFVGSTLAKYVTSAEAGDSARVAKFGVTITAADELFSDSYKDAKTTYTANEETGEITVQAGTAGTNVVAPGTQGALVGFAVTGTPEVDVQVTYDATLDLAGWELADSSEYCPIEITVGAETFKVGDNATDVADLKAKVEAAIEGKAALYHTNTDLSAVNDDVVVSWAWDFEGNSDVNDTYLGDQAAAGNDATIGLTVKTTITQVD